MAFLAAGPYIISVNDVLFKISRPTLYLLLCYGIKILISYFYFEKYYFLRSILVIVITDKVYTQLLKKY